MRSSSNAARAQFTQALPGQLNFAWNVETGDIDPRAGGTDAVAHLAGAPIAAGRWTAARKALIRRSRVDATRALVNGLARLEPPPKVFVSASAIGFFGDRADEELRDDSAPGTGFLADVAREWEAAALSAEAFGMRVVCARFGIVLSKDGGALPQIMRPFSFGLGGRLGSGRQWMSWIALADVIGALQFVLDHDVARGPINVVAPHPVRDAEFARLLGRAMHRPAALPVPAFALRLALGEMADALLLSSQRVIPERLTQLGYAFQHPVLPAALAAVLK
jgi:uncharacterized protein (TIGR01777 family)